MKDAFKIVEQTVPLPKQIEYADLSEEVYKLYARYGSLLNAHEAQQRQWHNTQRTLLLGFLEVADALDRMLQLFNPSDSEDTKKALERQRKNLEVTRRLLTQKLANAGVVKMDIFGKTLDPATTDVEDEQDDDTVPDETVLREIISGYWWNQTVLRRARVIVSHHL